MAMPEVGYAGTAGSRHAADMGVRSGLIPQTPAPQAVNPSAFGNIEDVMQLSSVMAQRVERIVARIAGDYPADASEGAPASPPNGLLDAADRQACDIRASLRRIDRAMDVLEKTLP